MLQVGEYFQYIIVHNGQLHLTNPALSVHHCIENLG